MKKKQLLLIFFCTFLFISSNKITYYSDVYNSNFYNENTFKTKPELLNKLEYHYYSRNNLIVYNDDLYIANTKIYQYNEENNTQKQLFLNNHSIHYNQIYIINNLIYFINDTDLLICNIKDQNIYSKNSLTIYSKVNISDKYFVGFYRFSGGNPFCEVYNIDNNKIVKKSLFYIKVQDHVLTQPILIDDILYIRTKSSLLAYNLNNQFKLWEIQINPLSKSSDEHTIVIKDNKIFLLEANFHSNSADVALSAYDINNGRLIWSTPFLRYFRDDFYHTKIYLYKDNVYVGTWGFNIETGEKILDDKIIIDNKRHTYHEEIACYNGVVYFCLDNGDICAYGLEEKEILWTYHFENDNNIKSIPKMCNGYLYVISKKALYKFGLE